jgi:hypothetical protein
VGIGLHLGPNTVVLAVRQLQHGSLDAALSRPRAGSVKTYSPVGVASSAAYNDSVTHFASLDRPPAAGRPSLPTRS